MGCLFEILGTAIALMILGVVAVFLVSAAGIVGFVFLGVLVTLPFILFTI